MNEENITLDDQISYPHYHYFYPDAYHLSHDGLLARHLSCWLTYFQIHLSYSQDCNINLVVEDLLLLIIPLIRIH